MAEMAEKRKKGRKGKKKENPNTTDTASTVPSSKEKFTFFFRKGSPFSQWHSTEFTVDDVEFTTAEQFMMYQKAVLFNDSKIAQKILKTDSPKEQKALGRKVSNFDDLVWRKNREIIVKKGNLAKFGQNPDLLEELKATQGTTLVEASPFDRVWGIGLSATNPKAANRSSWRGANLLGQILTSVREELMGTRGATPGDTPRTTEGDGLKPLPDPTAKGKPPI